MAALSLSHSLLQKHRIPVHPTKPTSRIQFSLPCRIHNSTGSSGSGGEKKAKKGGKEEEKRWRVLVELYGEAEKLGKGLKESLSPKAKGDWKDLVLMSFSFAVYVYMSQKLVCAYCAWISMLKHS